MAAKYTRLGQRETAAREWEVPAVSAFAVLYAAATLSVWLAVPVWTVQGKTTGLLDDWTQPPEGTATEPEPGTKALLWAALGFDLAAAAAAGLSVVPGLPTLIGRFGNRQAAAALAWVALVLTATAADAVGKPSSQAPLESTPPALTSKCPSPPRGFKRWIGNGGSGAHRARTLGRNARVFGYSRVLGAPRGRVTTLYYFKTKAAALHAPDRWVKAARSEASACTRTASGSSPAQTGPSAAASARGAAPADWGQSAPRRRALVR